MARRLIRASGFVAIERRLEPRDCECWLAKFSQAPCDRPAPRLWRIHLLDKQKLRQAGVDPWDPRSYVWGCGGWNGLCGHHGELDSYQLRVPFDELPPETIELAGEARLLGWLEKRYGAVVTV